MAKRIEKKKSNKKVVTKSNNWIVCG